MLSTSELRFSSTASLLSAVQVMPLYDCVQRDFFDYFLLCSVFNTASSAAPSDSTVSEGAGIDPRTVATSTLVVIRSNHSARSHPQTQLNLMYDCSPHVFSCCFV
jgi:hypothetical protein